MPLDWESLQNNTEANANRELGIPAPALLLEEELALVKAEDEGEQWEIRMGSCTEQDENSSTVAPQVAAGDAAAYTLPLPPPPTAQHSQVNYEAAWTILQNPKNSKEHEAVLILLSDLGADDIESLELLEEEHIRQLAALLKVVPSKRLLAVCSVAL